MFNYQGSFCCSFQATAFIFYQKLFSLSRTFLFFCFVRFGIFMSASSDIFSILSHSDHSVNNFFRFFQIFFSTGKLSFSRWSFILPHCSVLCQQLFTFIFQSIYIMVEMAQKKKSQSLKILLLLPIGSKRRKRDLNPRAGCPTYTLSRGASSAS